MDSYYTKRLGARRYTANGGYASLRMLHSISVGGKTPSPGYYASGLMLVE